MSKTVRRLPVKEGYDLWAPTYDTTKNPLVLLDRRWTFEVLSPREGEMILDAGCGTGYYMPKVLGAGARCVGIDLSRGMLKRTRAALPAALLVESNLDFSFPFHEASFDAVLSALVSEHIPDIQHFCREVARVLRPGGRFVWSVFHPLLAQAGTEANFSDEHGNEVRLGAEMHSVDDYRKALQLAGLAIQSERECAGDEEMARRIPRAKKYVGRPMLLIYNATMR